MTSIELFNNVTELLDNCNTNRQYEDLCCCVKDDVISYLALSCSYLKKSLSKNYIKFDKDFFNSIYYKIEEIERDTKIINRRLDVIKESLNKDNVKDLLNLIYLCISKLEMLYDICCKNIRK